ncbi:MAG: 2Fe-2S iron-sulfur cluster binding domain-containing protein [Nitrospira sp.]
MHCNRWSAAILASALGWAVPSLDHTAQGQHAEHHPGPGDSAGSSNASGIASGEGMGGGMGEMGGMGMGTSPPKELYPSLMSLPGLALETRAEVERQAHERMTKGAELMSEGLSALSSSAVRDDYVLMQQATEQMREGLAQFESGLAAHRALADARAPREIALQWFKREMHLLPASSGPPPHGIFGLSWFHYFVMALLLVSTASMVWMYYHRLRRADALLASLAGERQEFSAALLRPSATPPAASAAPIMVARTPAASDAATSLVTVPAGRWSGQLRVAKIFQETADVKTFRLVHPSGGDLPVLPFVFEPGQFLTVTVNIDGKETKRSYSIASSPCRRTFCELTVKQTPAGLVSNYLHERIQVGDLISVSGPFGKFTFRGHEAPSVVLIAGGVGITPLMSAIRCLTDQAWTGEIFMIYACNTMQDLIYHEELEYLVRRYENFQLTITLSRETSSAWTGPRGHVTRDLLTKAVPNLTTRRIHLCGPPAMMEAVKGILADMGVPPDQVKSENFLGAEPRPTKPPGAPTPVELGQAAVTTTCRFVRSGKTAPLAKDQTLLEASEDVGVNIDYSCRQGYCGVCKVKLLSGLVTMAVEEALTPQDKAANIILACQARSTANVEVEA